MKLFDYVIGNPPYQEEQVSENADGSLKNYAPPVYDKFMDEAFKVSEKVELIHPARFLFNAGSTSKDWNKKMLSDPHFKVLRYEGNASVVFPNTDIKGGIAITYYDRNKDFGAIGTFSAFSEVNSILRKVVNNASYKSIDSIVFSRTSFRLTPKVHIDYPDAKKYLSDGHLYDLSSNILQRLPFLFHDSPDEIKGSAIKVLGRDNNKRVKKYINAEYITEGKNLNGYKVFIPQASGRGSFGEALGTLIIEQPGTAATETFLSIGNFKHYCEAENVAKYLKTKFFRCLLSVLKVTQIGNKPVYKYVPIQDFTMGSDIDWSKSIHEIDLQLYRKYGLDEKEIEFIETHVKEMA